MAVKLKSILRSALTATAAVNPALLPAIVAINQFLPDGSKLSADANGQEAICAIKALPDDVQNHLLEKEIDLEIEREKGWTERYQAMCESDGQSTRPIIALIFAWAFVGLCVMFGVWVFTYPEQAADSIAWQVWLIPFGAVMGVLNKYFGELRREQTNRQSSINGFEAGSTLAKALGAFKR